MNGKILGQSWKFWLGAVIIFALLQAVFAFDLITEYIQTVLQYMFIMAIITLGLNLIYGFNGQFSLGQWGFYAIGAYASADVSFRVYKWAGKSGFDFEAGMAGLIGRNALLIVALLVGATIAAIVGFALGYAVLRMGGDYFGIATLGFTIVAKVLADNSDNFPTVLIPSIDPWFPEMKGARGMLGIPGLTTWFWVFFFFIMALVLMRNLIYSTEGRAIISVREDEIAARAMGIDTFHYKVKAFTIGAFYAGIAGGLYAHLYKFLAPNSFHFLQSFDIWIILVFGGVGSMTGTLVGTIFWAIMKEGLRLVLPTGTEAWRFVIYPMALLLVMLLRPDGVMGGRELGFLKAPRAPGQKPQPSKWRERLSAVLSLSWWRSFIFQEGMKRPHSRVLLLIVVLQIIPLIMPPLGGVAIIPMILLWLLMAWGLWSYQPWARLLTIFIQGFNIIMRVIVVLPNIVTKQGDVHLDNLVIAVIAVILSGAFLYFIDKSDMQLAFEQ